MPSVLQSLWQHQEPPFVQMPLEAIRQRADQALAHDRKYKFVGLFTASILVACFGLFFLVSATVLGRAGAAGRYVRRRFHGLARSSPCAHASFVTQRSRHRRLSPDLAARAASDDNLLAHHAAVQVGAAVNLLGDSQHDLRAGVTILATIAPVLVVAFLTGNKAQAYGRRVEELDRL